MGLDPKVWFCQHPSFSRYQMSDIQNRLKKYCYFMFEGKEGTRSSRVQMLFCDALNAMLEWVNLEHNIYCSLSFAHKLCHKLKYWSGFSLEQNSGCLCRQAFIHYCGLHQVWGRTEKLCLIWGLTGSLSMLRTC